MNTLYSQCRVTRTLLAIQIKYPYLNINCLYFHFTSSCNHTFELPCAINYNRQGISLLTASHWQQSHRVDGGRR